MCMCVEGEGMVGERGVGRGGALAKVGDEAQRWEDKKCEYTML